MNVGMCEGNKTSQSKPAVICLNGEPPKNELLTCLEGAFVVACDGAMNWLNVKPDLLVGDFDSFLGELPSGVEILTFAAEKDFTDAELALSALIERGFSTFTILGGGGGRDDHFWFNLALLLRILRSGGTGVMKTNFCDIFLFDQNFQLQTKPGMIISLSPYFESVHIIKTYGLKYALSERTLLAGESIGVSNVALAELAGADVSDGLVLVFVSENETR